MISIITQSGVHTKDIVETVTYVSNNDSCGPSGDGTIYILIFTPKIITLDSEDGSVKLKIELWVSLEGFSYHQDTDGAAIQQARRKNGSQLQFSALTLHYIPQFITVMQRNLPDSKIPIRSSADNTYFVAFSVEFDAFLITKIMIMEVVMYSPCCETTDLSPHPKYN